MTFKGRTCSREHRAKISKANKGEKSGRWQGDNVKKRTVHQWLNFEYAHEKVQCEGIGCTETKHLGFAYVGPNGEWLRDRDAYQILCPRCHKFFDMIKG